MRACMCVSVTFFKITLLPILPMFSVAEGNFWWPKAPRLPAGPKKRATKWLEFLVKHKWVNRCCRIPEHQVEYYLYFCLFLADLSVFLPIFGVFTCISADFRQIYTYFCRIYMYFLYFYQFLVI